MRKKRRRPRQRGGGLFVESCERNALKGQLLIARDFPEKGENHIESHSLSKERKEKKEDFRAKRGTGAVFCLEGEINHQKRRSKKNSQQQRWGRMILVWVSGRGERPHVTERGNLAGEVSDVGLGIKLGRKRMRSRCGGRDVKGPPRGDH